MLKMVFKLILNVLVMATKNIVMAMLIMIMMLKKSARCVDSDD